MTPLEEYLTALCEIRSSDAAVDETSYYGALETYFNSIGKTLKPKVRCILQLKNRGVGNPDGGFFTEEQYKKKSGQEPLPGQNPSRGVIEVKPTSDDAWVTAEGAQVTRYWGRYRQVLVTNYRDFVFVGQDLAGKPVKLESYRLADSEAHFWAAAAHPRKTDALHGEMFAEFAKRAMLHAAPLAAPEDLAWFLASYARDALARIGLHDLPALTGVRKALEEALGLTFEGEKGEHFFRSTLVQTLFYGVFSAWVLWAKQNPPIVAPGFSPASSPRFDWKVTAYFLRVPILRKLFHEIAEPGQLDELNLSEILDWTSGVLNRVDRPIFFAKFQEDQAVQYFYEPFLQAFDPELRKQLGVWYTPPEIVQYMVARVDTVLREELNLPEGLADKNVYVLDPCCGTGSYLVEVLKKIHETLKQRGEDALVASDLKEAAKNRVFGFELLPAPFVVSHLQLGLLLQNLGAPLAEKGNERIGVFLTNALTGWEPPKEPKKRLLFAELEEERDAAEHVKRDTPILVILGNPPYNAFAGVSPEEEQGLVEPYKAGLVKEWNIKKFNLDDLYIRFFRLAERRITERESPGKGVLSYISNFSYLSDPSFVVLRQRFLREFDSIHIDCMNGDSRETGKLTPDGKPDPSVFSTEFNRQGIRIGTAIGLFLRKGQPTAVSQARCKVQLRNFWGVGKRTDLVSSLAAKNFGADYEQADPKNATRFSFYPQIISRQYASWPTVEQLCAFLPTLGILENRQEALISIDRKRLEERMKIYFDERVEWETLRSSDGPLSKDFARFNARKAREKALKSAKYSNESLRPLLIRPMDDRWCYYTSLRPIWNESRPAYVEQLWPGNTTLVTRRKGVANPEGVPFFFTRSIGFQHALHTDAYYIPVQFRKGSAPKENPSQGNLLKNVGDSEVVTAPNLSSGALAYIGTINSATDAKGQSACEASVWPHVLAIAYSASYLSQNRDGIRQDWPRIPLPDSKTALIASAHLGRQVAALLDTESPVKGVTSGEIRTELKLLAVILRIGWRPSQRDRTRSHLWLGTRRQRWGDHARERQARRA